MKPAHTLFSENVIPFHLARCHLGDRRMSTVVRTHRRPNAETSLGKVKPVSHRSAHTVMLYPAHQRLVNASLVHEVLNQSPHGIIGERRYNRGFQPEAPFKSACDVIFSSSFVDIEFARSRDAPVAWIETEHHLPQTHQVPAALLLRPDLESHCFTLMFYSQRANHPPSTESICP